MPRSFFHSFILSLFILLTPAFASAKPAKADRQTVLFSVDLNCQACIDKIMHEIAFEKGVKDIVCSLKDKTVLVTYDANKTDIPTLQKAFARIHKPATVLSSSQPQSPERVGLQ